MNSTEHAISEAVTRLYLDTFGKGPMSVETHCLDDMAVTVLREVLTPAENALVEAGKADSVLVTRMEWQRATDGLFRAGVEKASARRVLAAVSGFEVEQRVATEVFLFASN